MVRLSKRSPLFPSPYSSSLFLFQLFLRVRSRNLLTESDARYMLHEATTREALFSSSISGYAPRSGRLELVLLLLECEHADRRTPWASFVSAPKNHHLRTFMRQRIRTQQHKNKSASSLVKTGTYDRCRGIILLFSFCFLSWCGAEVNSKQCGLTSNVGTMRTIVANRFWMVPYRIVSKLVAGAINGTNEN